MHDLIQFDHLINSYLIKNIDTSRLIFFLLRYIWFGKPVQLFYGTFYNVLPLLQIGSWESNREAGTRCGNRIARGGRRCRSDARVAPRSFVPVIPLLCLLFHGAGAEVSFLNYENDASRLFVIREAAGEISRRSTGSSEPTPFLRSSALLTMS